MKKIAILILMISQWAFSQTEKGHFIFSGNTSAEFSHTKTTFGNSENETTNFDVNPTVGYFVRDNLFVGLTGNFAFTHYNNNQSYVEKTTLTVLMPSVGYYFPVEGKMKPFVSGSFGYANLKSVYKNNFDPIIDDPAFTNSQTVKYKGLAYAISGGASYFVTNHFSLDAQLSYNFVNLKNKDSDSEQETSGIGFRIGFSVFLGN